MHKVIALTDSCDTWKAVATIGTLAAIRMCGGRKCPFKIFSFRALENSKSRALSRPHSKLFFCIIPADFYHGVVSTSCKNVPCSSNNAGLESWWCWWRRRWWRSPRRKSPHVDSAEIEVCETHAWFKSPEVSIYGNMWPGLWSICYAFFVLDLTRKKTKQLIEQSAERFNDDTDEVVNKHNKRWAAKFGNVRVSLFRIRDW